MNPSSLGIDIIAVQRQKDMYKYAGSELFVDEGNARDDMNAMLIGLLVNNPLSMAHAGDDRLFVVERGGTIRIISGSETTEPSPFLDISGIIKSGGEQVVGERFYFKWN